MCIYKFEKENVSKSVLCEFNKTKEDTIMTISASAQQGQAPHVLEINKRE
jgi:hypothetical protein